MRCISIVVVSFIISLIRVFKTFLCFFSGILSLVLGILDFLLGLPLDLSDECNIFMLSDYARNKLKEKSNRPETRLNTPRTRLKQKSMRPRTGLKEKWY